MARDAAAWYPSRSSEVRVVDVAILKMVGFSALALLVLGWLVVSFLPPGRARRLDARFAAIAMYLALVCFFTNLTQRAWDKDRNGVLRPVRLPARDVRRGLGSASSSGCESSARADSGASSHPTRPAQR